MPMCGYLTHQSFASTLWLVRSLTKKGINRMKQTNDTSLARGTVLVFGLGELGEAIVEAFVAQGVTHIAGTYNSNKAKADAFAKKLKSLGVEKVFFDRMNQSDEADVHRFLDAAVETCGTEIAVAVNTIGISPNKSLRKQTLESVGEKIDDKGWREIFEVNVFGCFISTRAVAERMKKKKVRGVITLITSTNGINSHSQISAHYDSSKAAQSHMMRNVAEEYAQYGIRVNGVAPGWINTSMNKTLPKREREKEVSRIWSKRFAEPKEVASVVAFLSGKDASYIMGQDIMVDGGYR